MVELEDDTLEVKFMGEVINLEYPSLDQLDKIGNLDDVNSFKNFFVSLGMPESIVGKIKLHHAKKIIEELTEKKN